MSGSSRAFGRPAWLLQTLRNHRILLRAFFRWAAKHRHCVEYPTDDLKLEKKQKTIGVALSLEEARRLLKACVEPDLIQVEPDRRRHCSWSMSRKAPGWVQLGVLTALHTGLRRENVAGLRWRHIDWRKKFIDIPAAEMKNVEDFTTPIHPELFEALEHQLKELGEVPPKEGFVLGRQIVEVRYGLAGALKRAGLPHFRWHDLRALICDLGIGQGPFVVLKILMGHSVPDTTFKYTHPTMEDLRKVIDSMPRLLESNPISKTVAPSPTASA